MKDVVGWIVGVLFLAVLSLSLYATCKLPAVIARVVQQEKNR